MGTMLKNSGNNRRTYEDFYAVLVENADEMEIYDLFDYTERPSYDPLPIAGSNQCCKNCKFFRGGICKCPDIGLFDDPAEDGSDWCENWEERKGRRVR